MWNGGDQSVGLVSCCDLVVGLLLRFFDSWTENRRPAFDKEPRIESESVTAFAAYRPSAKGIGRAAGCDCGHDAPTSLIQMADSGCLYETGEWGAASAPQGVAEAARGSFRAVSLMRLE